MIDIQEEYLNIVKQILHQHIPNVPVWVFGSRIKGTAKSYSDLDLVIVDEHKIPLTNYYQIKDAFEESTLPFRVDILDWHRISFSFRTLIKENYVVLV